MTYRISAFSKVPGGTSKQWECKNLLEVSKILTKYISFNKPRSWMDEMTCDVTKIESDDMEYDYRTKRDIMNHLENSMCNAITFLDDCFLDHIPCTLKIKKLKNEYVGEKAEKMYIDNDITAANALYRTFQVTPEKVIFNDPATIVFWKDGTKTVVKCMEGDTYNPEVGLAMCVCKKVFDKKYHKFFKYYTKDAPTRPLLGNVTEATAASYYSPIDEVINIIKAVFEDTKGESK